MQIGSVQEGGPSQEFHFPGWEFCCWHHFKAMVGQGPWMGFLCMQTLFTQQGDHENCIPCLLGHQLQCLALNHAPPRGPLEEVMWCLSELALMLGSCAGPPSTGFSAGTGGTGTHWRKAHQGKQHVPHLHLPHRSRQPEEEAAWKACAISYGRAGSSIWLCFTAALPGAAEGGQSGACGWCARSRRGGGE